nr:M56 family metallopeptidase [Catalinimonas alkaloidigena]
MSTQPFQTTYENAATAEVESQRRQLSSLVDQAKSYVNTHLHWIVMGWILGVLLFSLKFAGSLIYIQTLKKKWISPLTKEWEKKVHCMTEHLGLEQNVKVLVSHMARVPIMLGHLRPIILIPASMMSKLPEDQIEAIIAHEIAHVYRKDYWINILQSLFEIIFFFHPAIWWINSVIREEREKCCDDLAVSICGNSLTYAKALASVEEVKLLQRNIALAVNGGKSSLLLRIERILEPGKKGENPMARFISVSVVAAILLLLSTSGDSIAYRYGEKVHKALEWANFPNPISMQDTAVNLDIENDVDIKPDPGLEISKGINIDEEIDVDLNIDVSENKHDTLPNTTKPQMPVHPFTTHIHADLHLSHDSLRQVKIATSIANQIHAFPNIDSVLMNLNPLDSIPDIVMDISAILDNIPKFDYSFGFDSTIDIRTLNDSLPQALAQLDSSLHRLDTHTNNYRLYVQDTSIEKRLRELEASMRKKEKEFEKLMREKEVLIREFMEEKAQEMKEHEMAFEQRMEVQERMLEKQMLQQEEQFRLEEEQFRKQIEQDEELMRIQEERFQVQESQFEKANRALENELKKDDLIREGEKYTFKLSSQGLFLNEEKLSDRYYQKYLNWMKEHEVFQFEEGFTFSISRIAE